MSAAAMARTMQIDKANPPKWVRFTGQLSRYNRSVATLTPNRVYKVFASSHLGRGWVRLRNDANLIGEFSAEHFEAVPDFTPQDFQAVCRGEDLDQLRSGKSRLRDRLQKK
jgi:hypothetical protein